MKKNKEIYWPWISMSEAVRLKAGKKLAKRKPAEATIRFDFRPRPHFDRAKPRGRNSQLAISARSALL